jgi:hypothetical protein
MQEWIKSQIIIEDLIKEQSSTIIIPDDAICPICHEDNPNVQTICLHNFHYECLNTHYHKCITRYLCPYCKQKFNNKCFEKTQTL